MSGFHVCGRSPGRRYHARARHAGARRWDYLGPARKNSLRAMQDMVREWETDKSPRYFEAEVIMCDDWYEPTPVAVLRRK